MTALGISSDRYTCPDWYMVIQAAKYLGVAPWELMEQSVYWRDKAAIAMTAEHNARKSLEDREK